MLQLVDQHTVGTSVLLHLSACDLTASEHVSIYSQTCRADGLLLHILAGMVVLSSALVQHFCWRWECAVDGCSSVGLAKQGVEQHHYTWLIGVHVWHT